MLPRPVPCLVPPIIPHPFVSPSTMPHDAQYRPSLSFLRVSERVEGVEGERGGYRPP